MLAYSLLPLPTTPLFVAAGMAKVSPLAIIPAFFVGKFASDTAVIFMGRYAVTNTQQALSDLSSWKSVVGLTTGLALLAALLFVDWRTLLQKHRLAFDFQIWK